MTEISGWRLRLATEYLLAYVRRLGSGKSVCMTFCTPASPKSLLYVTSLWFIVLLLDVLMLFFFSWLLPTCRCIQFMFRFQWLIFRCHSTVFTLVVFPSLSYLLYSLYGLVFLSSFSLYRASGRTRKTKMQKRLKIKSRSNSSRGVLFFVPSFSDKINLNV